MMRFDSVCSELPPGPLQAQCMSFKKSLHEHSPYMVEIFGGIQSWYSGNINPEEDRKEQVDSLLHLISACHSTDWEGYLAALENIIKYFFAIDLLNYTHLMPVHLAQVNALEQDDCLTWEALKLGDFVVAKSEIPFAHLFTDQAHGGMVGLSRDEVALD